MLLKTGAQTVVTMRGLTARAWQARSGSQLAKPCVLSHKTEAVISHPRCYSTRLGRHGIYNQRARGTFKTVLVIAAGVAIGNVVSLPSRRSCNCSRQRPCEWPDFGDWKCTWTNSKNSDCFYCGFVPGKTDSQVAKGSRNTSTCPHASHSQCAPKAADVRRPAEVNQQMKAADVRHPDETNQQLEATDVRRPDKASQQLEATDVRRSDETNQLLEATDVRRSDESNQQLEATDVRRPDETNQQLKATDVNRRTNQGEV